MIVDEVGADILRYFKHDTGAKFEDMVFKIDVDDVKFKLDDVVSNLDAKPKVEGR